MQWFSTVCRKPYSGLQSLIDCLGDCLAQCVCQWPDHWRILQQSCTTVRVCTAVCTSHCSVYVSSKSKTALQFHFKCSALCSVAAVSECVVLCAPIDGYRLHGNCALTSRLPSLLLLPLLLPARPFVCDAFVRSAPDD